MMKGKGILDKPNHKEKNRLSSLGKKLDSEQFLIGAKEGGGRKVNKGIIHLLLVRVSKSIKTGIRGEGNDVCGLH